MLQGILQVIGVTSIFPFLALVADPQRINDSQFGRFFLSFLPEMETSQLLVVAGIFAIVMLLFANMINILGEFHRNRYAHQLGHWLRLRLLNRFASRDYKFFVENNSGVLVKKVYSDVVTFVDGVLLPLLDACARAVTSILLILTLLFIHLEIALTAAACLGVTYFCIYFFLKKPRQTIATELKSATRESMVELQHLFGAIKPIKVAQTDQYFINRFSGPSEKHAKYFAWLPVYVHLPRYVIEPLAFGGMIALAIFFILSGKDMATAVPNMGVMALAGHKLLPSLQLLYGQITKISAMQFALHELNEELTENDWADSQGDTKQSAATGEALDWNYEFAFNDVGFHYGNPDAPVLDGVTFRVPKNSSIGIVGSTGSGKTTLIDLLLGLHNPVSGEILIDGEPLNPDNLSAWRNDIGYVPQDVFLIDDSIASNIALGVEHDAIDQQKLLDAAKTAQIFDFIENELPKGFSTEVGERGVRLSGGQRQRIGLARAIYRDCSILVFDEATSALDNDTEQALMTAIHELNSDELNSGKTIVMIAHRLNSLRNCEKIIRIEDGRAFEVSFEAAKERETSVA